MAIIVIHTLHSIISNDTPEFAVVVVFFFKEYIFLFRVSVSEYLVGFRCLNAYSNSNFLLFLNVYSQGARAHEISARRDILLYHTFSEPGTSPDF